MEKLHAATLYLFRFGGVHPFKTEQYSNQLKISVRLLLWTFFLQLTSILCSVYFLVISPKIGSLQVFLTWGLFLFWTLINILLPIHFISHGKDIAAVNGRFNNIRRFCSINNLKISTKSKLTLLSFFLGKIIWIFICVLEARCRDTSSATTIFTKLTYIFFIGNSLMLDIIASYTFVIYLTIQAESFSHYNACLEELFDGRRPFIRQISVLPAEEYSYKTNVSALHTLGVDQSNHAQQSVTRNKTTNTLPYSRPTNDPRQQFTESLGVRTRHVSRQTCVHDANMQDFFQRLEEIHASIFEEYNVYELCKCIFGLPLLCKTTFQTISYCTSSYKLVKEFDLEDNCSIISVLLLTAMLLNNIVLTMLPHTLDQNVSSSY